MLNKGHYLSGTALIKFRQGTEFLQPLQHICNLYIIKRHIFENSFELLHLSRYLHILNQQFCLLYQNIFLSVHHWFVNKPLEAPAACLHKQRSRLSLNTHLHNSRAQQRHDLGGQEELLDHWRRARPPPSSALLGRMRKLSGWGHDSQDRYPRCVRWKTAFGQKICNGKRKSD